MRRATTVSTGACRTRVEMNQRLLRDGRMGCRAIAFATLLATSAAMAQSQPAAVASGDHAPTGAPAIRLDAGDLLEVSTFDTPELSGKFRIDSRGYVTLPVGGAVPVQGLTAEQAGTAMERQLRDRDILKNPHVTVLVLEYATQGISVLGEVKQPGIYPLAGKHGVLDFVSLAGGLTLSASKVVSITHRAPPWDTVTVNLDGERGGSLGRAGGRA